MWTGTQIEDVIMDNKVLEQMYSSAIIPVVAIDNSEDAVELGKAFLAAGV